MSELVEWTETTRDIVVLVGLLAFTLACRDKQASHIFKTCWYRKHSNRSLGSIEEILMPIIWATVFLAAIVGTLCVVRVYMEEPERKSLFITVCLTVTAFVVSIFLNQAWVTVFSGGDAALLYYDEINAQTRPQNNYMSTTTTPPEVGTTNWTSTKNYQEYSDGKLRPPNPKAAFYVGLLAFLSAAAATVYIVIVTFQCAGRDCKTSSLNQLIIASATWGAYATWTAIGTVLNGFFVQRVDQMAQTDTLGGGVKPAKNSSRQGLPMHMKYRRM